MKSTIRGMRITAICAVVPSQISRFEDEIKTYPFSEQSSRKLARIMGFKEHRIAPPEITLMDLAEYGFRHLADQGCVSVGDLDLLVFVSHQHEYPVPGNSRVLNGRLKLKPDTHCVDIFDNCAGFITGLHAAASMLASSDAGKAVIITSNSGTCYLNAKDRNTYPLMGDAATVTVLEKSGKPEDRFDFVFHHDGSFVNTLIVPAGGMRRPLDSQSQVEERDELGNIRRASDLHMDGANVFHFVMGNVPKTVDEVCALSEHSKDDIDYFITHQPNRFLVDKLTELLGVPKEKVFNNVVENFGNSSSSTLGVTMCFNLKERLQKEGALMCLSAFGAGMSVGGVVCKIGALACCDLIEHP